MNKKRFFAALLVTMMVAAVVCGGLFAALSAGGSSRNILLLGVDKDGTRSDTIMVVSVDASEKAVSILSIPRDTRVQVGGNTIKINACMGYEEKEALLMEEIEELTGLVIDNYCKVDFEGFRNVIDILGGVEFDVPMDMDYDDPAQDLHIHLKAGLQVLDGAAAEGLVRFRSGYANADLGRVSVQQDFVKALIEQKANLGLITKAPSLLEQMEQYVETDLSVGDIIGLVWTMKGMDTASIESYTLPGTPQTIGGVSYYLCDEEEASALVNASFTPTR